MLKRKLCCLLLILLLPGCTPRRTEQIAAKPEKKEELILSAGIVPVSQEALPERYDAREHNRVSLVRNQGEWGTCWAFTALSALESRLRPEENLLFSPDHMSKDPWFCLGQNRGGDYTMAMAYLLSWRGPILEEQDPYGDGVTVSGVPAVKHVQEIRILPEGDREALKRAVWQWGGVESALYADRKNSHELSESYRTDTYAYCYPEPNVPNHDVVIVGWDDHFPKEAFSAKVGQDGAFICQNSWGTGFGDQGFFYVSYEDGSIGKHNIVYTEVKEPEKYSRIWQTDACGWIGQIGYGEETAWAANVYQTEKETELSAAGFYAVDRDTDYEVYVVEQMEGSDIAGNLKKRKLVARGHLDYAGYYTIPFAQARKLEPMQKFAVVVRLNTPGAIHPIAVEYDTGDGKCRIDLTDGEGYVSPDGVQWERTEKTQDCNICLKAYGN